MNAAYIQALFFDFRMSDGFYDTDWTNQDSSQGYTNQAYDQNAYSGYDQSQSYNPNTYGGDMYTPGISTMNVIVLHVSSCSTEISSEIFRTQR